MKTMLDLCGRLARRLPGLEVDLRDYGVTCKSLYRVDIGRRGYRKQAFYFKSCKEFSDFIRNCPEALQGGM